jgi:hypothetical protein
MAAAHPAQREPSSGPHNSAAARSLTSNAVAYDIEQDTDEAFPQRLVAALPGRRSARKTAPETVEALHPASTASTPRTTFGGWGRRHRGEASGSDGGEPRVGL